MSWDAQTVKLPTGRAGRQRFSRARGHSESRPADENPRRSPSAPPAGDLAQSRTQADRGLTPRNDQPPRPTGGAPGCASTPRARTRRSALGRVASGPRRFVRLSPGLDPGADCQLDVNWVYLLRYSNLCRHGDRPAIPFSRCEAGFACARFPITFAAAQLLFITGFAQQPNS